jgi:superfamily II DNA or RNA helicase
MIELFPDQLTFVDGLRDAFRNHQSVMGCAATGFGKTVTSAYIAKSATERKKRVIFSVHRDNLLTQTSGTFNDFRIPHGFIASGMPYHRDTYLHVASILTLQRRLDKIEPPDLLVIDEAHLAMAKGWKTVADYFRARGTKVLGNSASPQRLDGKSLRDLFDTMVMGPEVRWLMDNGRLSDYEYYAPDVPDMSTIRKQMGDYDQRTAGELMDKPKLIGSVVANYKRLAMGRRTVCFCINVRHSLNTVAEFIANGVPAAHIDGNTPSGERKRILNDFADGKILVLCNVELVTTGFDLSAQVGRDVPVECVILCRPTMSLALFVQMVGRALRRKAYPAIILDHAGNSLRHGFPDDPRYWNLDGDEVTPTGPREGPPPPVTCTGCYRQVRRPAPSHCPHCGKRLMAEAKPIVVAEGDLVLQTDDLKAAIRFTRAQEERDAKTLQELVALGAQRGYASPQTWAFKKWSNSRFRNK